jgi:hypothetical protein
MNSDKTIFIGIAAFNEVDVISTIENCLEHAVYPDRLYFGLALQYCDMEKPVINFPNVRSIDIAYGTGFGVCPTRSLAIQLYDDQDFYLQLDGHMKFDQGWDEYLIDVFNQATNAGYEKPLFTNYVPWWCYEEDMSVANYSPASEIRCGVMKFSDELGRNIPQQEGKPVDWEYKQHDFAEHHGFSAHFAFADASFIKDVPPDTDYMFYGEEPTTALRAWTRGYRIFSVKKATVWHRNKMPESKTLHDRDRMKYGGYDHDLMDLHSRKDQRAWKKAQQVLSGDLLGFWGAPDHQSYLDYVKASGYNFREFYAKNLEYELNRVDPGIDLGYNSEQYNLFRSKKIEAGEAKNA